MKYNSTMKFPRPVIFLIVGIMFLTGGILIGRYVARTRQPVVRTFSECVGSGYPVMESYPRRCRTPDGQTFTEAVSPTPDIPRSVRVTSPQPDTAVTSPLTVSGEAVGPWYFEGSFPVALTGPDGAVLASEIAEARGDWMTEGFVPFTVTLTFTPPQRGVGELVLMRDNPSGLPQNAAQLRIPVRFGN